MGGWTTVGISVLVLAQPAPHAQDHIPHSVLDADVLELRMKPDAIDDQAAAHPAPDS